MASPQSRRPDRFTGLPSGVVVAPLGRRFVAHLVDLVVPGVIALVAFVVPALGGGSPSAAATTVGSLLLVVWSVVVWWMLATRAAGPGMQLMKLQLVGFADGRPIGWGRVLLRALVLALLSVTGIGLLLMVVLLVRHPRRQGWHDLVGNAVMIQARALAPRDRRPPPAEPTARVAPSASPAPTPAASPAPSSGASRAPAPAASPAATPAPAPAAAPAPSPTRWVAVLDDGRELVVDGLVLLGRNPQPRPGEEGAQLIKLSDESRTVSKSHLALDVDEHGLFVVDRDSTNGSTLTTTGGEAFRCVPGQATYIGNGSVVSVGDHSLTFQLTAADRQGEKNRPR